MPSILFVCTANRFRSPLAAALFKSKLQADKYAQPWRVESAGTWGLEHLPPMPEALIEAEKRKLDIRAHQSRIVNYTLLKGFDLIIVMEEGHKEALRNEFRLLEDRIFLLTEVGGGSVYSIPDPYTTQESPEKVANEIESQIERCFAVLYRSLYK